MSRAKGSPKTGGIKKGGKHKKTIKREIAQEMALDVFRQEIRKNWGELMRAQLELAKGIWIEKIIDNIGRARVYREKPNSQSLEYVFSVVVGKPKEGIDVNMRVKLEKLEELQDGFNKIIDAISARAKGNG